MGTPETFPTLRMWWMSRNPKTQNQRSSPAGFETPKELTGRLDKFVGIPNGLKKGCIDEHPVEELAWKGLYRGEFDRSKQSTLVSIPFHGPSGSVPKD